MLVTYFLAIKQKFLLAIISFVCLAVLTHWEIWVDLLRIKCNVMQQANEKNIITAQGDGIRELVSKKGHVEQKEENKGLRRGKRVRITNSRLKDFVHGAI